MLLTNLSYFFHIDKVIARRTDPQTPLILLFHANHLFIDIVHLQILDFLTKETVLKLMSHFYDDLSAFDG